jgi:hypothetical protein
MKPSNNGEKAMDGIKKDRHHRHPKSRRSSFMGDIHDKRNISIVDPKLHRAYHLLFQNRTAPEIARLLTDVWISPDMVMIAVPRHKPAHKKRRKRKYCVDCECEVLKHIPKTSKEEK